MSALLFVCSAGYLTAARPARALQPLDDFLEHARTWNPENRVAHSTVDQREAEVGVSTGNVEPNVQLNALYTRNQFEVTTNSLFPSSGGSSMVPNSVIQPQNQVDGNATLTVPILNVVNWTRRTVSKATLAQSKADENSAALSVQRTVVRTYFQLLGYEAVVQSARQNHDVAMHNVQLSRNKLGSGAASELDVQRALADAARAAQAVTAAALNVTLSRRALYSATGVSPEPASSFPDDDLHAEAPLESWISSAGDVPSVRSAEASTRAAEEATHAARSAWIPTLSGTAEEKLTNATAFSGGHSAFYLLQLSASWKLDSTILPQIRVQRALATTARANEDRVRRAAKDAVYSDWQQVRADIETSGDARAQVTAAKLAASLAEDRYAYGAATQLDVLQARQDTFAADVARIQADADLAYARAALRIDSARALGRAAP